jgi:hypothetical protein
VKVRFQHDKVLALASGTAPAVIPMPVSLR